jgi:hypothetical protein
MCCNNMWCHIDMSHCEWAACGYEGLFGVGFIVVCRYSSVCNQIKLHTSGCSEVARSTTHQMYIFAFHVRVNLFQ